MQITQVIVGDPKTYPFVLSMTSFGTLSTTAGYYLQVIIPLMMAFCVLLLFSNNYEGHSGEYLYSLPPSRLFLTFGRWGRLVLSFLPGYLVDLWACWRGGEQLLQKLGQPLDIPFFHWVLNNLPCVLFLCGLALFLLVVGKRFLYGLILVVGLPLVDLVTGGFLLEKATFLVGMFGREVSLEQVLWNRGIYLALGLMLPLLAGWIASTKGHRRRL